jgi:hypothetical protein
MMTRRTLLSSVAGFALFAVSGPAIATDTPPISPKARELLRVLDSYDLDHLWLAGQKVHWDTGLPTGQATTVTPEHKHTHCSAFVASVAKTLGIYILRPPEHSATLLANAQLDWLESGPAASGWRPIGDAASAQAAANQGDLVVACYRNHKSDRPGHIAIVRPSDRPSSAIAADGPEVTQAGLHNYRETTLRAGFAGHPTAWDKAREIRFFAHDWDGKIHFTGSITL